MVSWTVIPGPMRDWLIRKLTAQARTEGSYSLPATIVRGEDVRVERKAPVESDLTNDDGTQFTPTRPHDPWRPESHL